MNEVLDKQQAIQKEIEQKKKDQQRQLLIKAHQIRAVIMSGDTEFFKIGQEECDLLRKVFPDEADKLLAQAMKDKLSKAEKKEKKEPGSVDRSSLLEELEALCGKAFKLMLENMKSKDKGKQQESHLSDAEKTIGNAAQMSEVENVREIEAPEKNKEMQKETLIIEKKKEKSLFKKAKENIEDGYHEGYTGEKVVRPEETEYETVKLSKKDQKKLDKEQKKAEKEQKKAEKASKNQKVAPISREALENEKNQMGTAKTADQIRQDQINKEKLEAYNKKLQERVSSKGGQQMASENVREMSGPVRKKS